MPDFERPATSALCHSFRHSFIDALRLAGVPGEINFALVGHTDPSVNGKYGAKDKAVRFRHRLAEAIASVAYAGFGLVACDEPASKEHQGAPRSTKEHQGAPRSTKEHQGAPRSTKEHQGAPRSTKEHQGAPRSTKEHQGAPRSTKEHTRLHGANEHGTPARGRRGGYEVL